MFCPKCGGQNSDETAFCRQCGEDLKIISQAMSGHAPLEIASKIDAVIGTGYERFRRDAILWVFWGILFLPMMILPMLWTEGEFLSRENASVYLTLFTILSIPSLLMFAAAAWNFLLFRRARELETTKPNAHRQTVEEERIFCPH